MTYRIADINNSDFFVCISDSGKIEFKYIPLQKELLAAMEEELSQSEDPDI